jgi:hypothetical protein
VAKRQQPRIRQNSTIPFGISPPSGENFGRTDFAQSLEEVAEAKCTATGVMRQCCCRPGGPFKPGFGLSGVVLPLETMFPPLVRVSVPSTPTRSLRVPQRRLRSGESCSTASPPDDRITLASPDCDEYSAASPQTAGNFEC